MVERIIPNGLLGNLRRQAGIYFFDAFGHCGYKLYVEGLERLKALHDSSDSLVVVFNHGSHDDIFAVRSAMAQGQRMHGLRGHRCVIPTADYYMKHDKAYQVGVAVFRAFNTDTPVVNQGYRQRVVKDDHATAEPEQMTDSENGCPPIHFVKDLLQKREIIIYSPEGHRSDDGQLGPAENALGFTTQLLIKKGQNVNVLPIAIIPVNGHRQRGFTIPSFPRTGYRVVLCGPKNVEQLYQAGMDLIRDHNLTGDDPVLLEREAITHAVMCDLASNLEPNQRGVYNPDNPKLLKLVLSGKVKYGMLPGGKAGLVIKDGRNWRAYTP